MVAKDKFKILVIDNTQTNSKLLRIFLTDADYEVIVIEYQSSVLDILSTEKIDVILLSIFMPGMNWIAILKIIKCANEKRSIPVILLSPLDKIDTKEIVSETGAEDFLCMPYSRDDVLNKVQEFLLKDNKRIIKMAFE